MGWLAVCMHAAATAAPAPSYRSLPTPLIAHCTVQCWYAAYFAALACVFPFLNLFFRRLGLDEQRIGLLGAVRPFVSMPAGSLWSGAADKGRRHRAVLLLTLCASVLARLSLSAVGRLGFVPLLATVAATEFFAAPVTILADAGEDRADLLVGHAGCESHSHPLLRSLLSWAFCALPAPPQP